MPGCAFWAMATSCRASSRVHVGATQRVGGRGDEPRVHLLVRLDDIRIASGSCGSDAPVLGAGAMIASHEIGGFMLRSRRRTLTSVAVAALAALTCDDAQPTTNVGGLVFVIRTFHAESDKFTGVDRIAVDYDRVEAVHDTARRVVLDTHVRQVVLPNLDQDTVVAQYQVPVGSVSQLRIFATKVTVFFKDGTQTELDPDTSDLPSWRNTGWKIGSDSTAFPIVLDQLTGMRGLLHFDDRLVHQGNDRWKLKPTLPAEVFAVNPQEGAPGVFLDQLTVVFKDGTTPARIDAINSEIRAKTVIAPPIGKWYRIKLPSTINALDAPAFYLSKPEVRGVMPAINFGDALSPNDDPNSVQHDIVRLRAAWDIAADAGNFGRSTVIGAVIESDGVDVTNPDLRRNIWLNQGELPLALFDTNDSGVIEPSEIARYDVDPQGGDGLITIRDLELEDAGIRPADSNRNGLVDGIDLLNDRRWANGINEDRNGISEDRDAGFVDDLIGWDFGQDDNDPSPTTTDGGQHGTAVASILAAEGNNDAGIAGVVWRSSIVVLRASIRRATFDGGDFGTPAETFQAAVRYAEGARATVVNVTQAWNFARKGYGTCGLDLQTTRNIAPRVWDAAVQQVFVNYPALFQSTRALYVFAAGNSAHREDDDLLLTLPGKAAWLANPDRTLLVGNAASAVLSDSSSNYAGAVELWAPGVGWTLPTYPSAQSGSSFSAPVVSGTALQLASLNPSFLTDTATLKAALVGSASARVTVRACTTTQFEKPLLNIEAALGWSP